MYCTRMETVRDTSRHRPSRRTMPFRQISVSNDNYTSGPLLRVSFPRSVEKQPSSPMRCIHLECTVSTCSFAHWLIMDSPKLVESPFSRKFLVGSVIYQQLPMAVLVIGWRHYILPSSCCWRPLQHQLHQHTTHHISSICIISSPLVSTFATKDSISRNSSYLCGRNMIKCHPPNAIHRSIIAASHEILADAASKPVVVILVS